MLAPRFRWTFPEDSATPPDAIATAARLGLSERLVGLLARRLLPEH